MKKLFRFTISKKIFLLTASLSIALIVISVVVASAVFNVRTKSEARKLCGDSAASLSEYISEYEMVVDSAGGREYFVKYYKARIDDIYKENRSDIERMSEKTPETDTELIEKKVFFDEITYGLFSSGGGFGLSYDLLNFKVTYPEIIEEMERISYLDGLQSCKLFYYDSESNKIVYLCDSLPANAFDYNFPCSAEMPPEDFYEDFILKGSRTEAVYNVERYYAGYSPVVIGGETVAYAACIYSADRVYDAERSFLWTLIGIMLFVTVAIVVIYMVLANRWLVKNVKKLSASARTFTSRMEKGELKPIDAEIRTHDEIGNLSDDFFALQNKVIAYSDDIARKSAAEERMNAELGVASKIQMQSLPDKTLIAGDIRIASFIKPAKEVGGDLFDYFVTDEGKVFFTIADVSGKSVPAALFMMRGKEIIRSCARAGMSAGSIAETANKELCKNNREGLFITAFIGIYDPSTGVLTFVRAGHEPPFLLRDGKAEKIGEESNFVLGAFNNMSFAEDSVEIKEGDRLLLYTDGLNEGINEANEEFGYDRIREVLEDPEGDILASMYSKALGFAGNAEQFDDITMLLIECVRGFAVTLAPPAFADIPKVTDRVRELAAGLDPDKISELGVVIDELMNNFISYAFEGVRKPRLDVDAKLFDGVMELTFTDNGNLFDPLKVEDPDVEADLSERPEGGLGIMLTRTFSDKLSYCVFEGKNRLTVVKRLTADEKL